MDITTRTVKGVLWSGISQVITQILQFAVRIVLARLLVPEYFGVVGMAMIFIGFMQTLNELGLSAAIIQKKDIDEKQISTMFWASVAAGFVLAAVSATTAPLIASFFDNEALVNVVRALSIGFFVGAFGNAHSSLLQRETDFKKIAIVETSSAAVYGAVSIGFAISGMGLWSLVVGALAQTLVRTVLFWLVCPWKPAFVFDYRSFWELFSFGKNVMGSRMLNYVDSNTDYLVVGKFLNADSLGLYTLAYQIAVFPTFQISKIMSRVTFPVFSMIQEDNSKICKGYLRVIRYTSLITFPTLLGIALVAPDFVPLAMGQQWRGMVLPLQILCAYGMLTSIGTHMGSVLLAKGRSDIHFRWNVLTVVAFPLAVIIGVKFGINGVAAAMVVVVISLFLLIQTITNRLIGLTLVEYFRALVPASICSIVMGSVFFAFKGISVVFSLGSLVALIGATIAGAFFYFLSFMLRYAHVCKELKVLFKLAVDKETR